MIKKETPRILLICSLRLSGYLSKGAKMNNATTKTLRRSRRNRIFAGVCGGLAEFFGLSAFWFRLAFLLALIPGGIPGFLVYILAWLIIPSEK
jgi:phage shock protein C